MIDAEAPSRNSEGDGAVAASRVYRTIVMCRRTRLGLEKLETTSGVGIAEDLDAPLVVSQSFAFNIVNIPGETFARRVGVQCAAANGAMTYVIIVILKESEPKPEML